jgi:hypothetical protein
MSAEPGLDLHALENECESIMADAEDALNKALPLLDELVPRMLEQRGRRLPGRVRVPPRRARPAIGRL